MLSSMLAVASEPTGSTTDWTRFRGENGIGVIAECHVPLPWHDDHVRWNIELPGVGNGSPIVHGDRVFVMSSDPHTATRSLLCYELTSGSELWRRDFEAPAPADRERSGFASCTPCSNEHAVYFAWATPDKLTLIALDHDGKDLWKRDLGPYPSQHGFGTSPALFGNLLILFNSQNAEANPPGESRVMAFDPKSGETAWERPVTTTNACYGVPCLYHDRITDQDALLFCNTGDGMFALALESGKMLWNKPLLTKRSVSCPQVVGDIGIGTEGSGGGGRVLYAVDLQSPDHELVFEVKRAAPYVPTPVISGSLIFMWNDQGIASCVEAPSGEVLWSKRIGGNASSSPVIAGDKLIGVAEDGTLTILAASRGFKEFGSITLGDTAHATPLVQPHYLLIRTDSRMMCIGDPSAK